MRNFQSRCIRWAEDHLEWLEVAEPVIPVDLHDRAADNWEPLLAIADTAGGDWPHRARKAAITLSSDETEETAGVMLLADIQQIFEARGSTRLKSSELVAALSEIEDRPWPEWRNGKAISAVQVARLLKPFGIKPKNIRDVSVFKGYEQSDFDDAISRYLPVSPATPLQDCKNRDSAVFSAATQRIAVADKNMLKPLENKLCSVVAAQETEVGGKHCQGIDTDE